MPRVAPRRRCGGRSSRPATPVTPGRTVRADFDEPTLAEITPERLAAVWAQVAASVGRHERMGEPYARRVGEHTVVDVPLGCEAGEVLARVAFNADGSVGGLFLLPR